MSFKGFAFSTLLHFLFLVGATTIFTACEVSESSDSDSDGDDDDGDDDGDDDDSEITNFRARVEANDATYSVMTTVDGEAADCIADDDNQLITCIFEFEELDLFFHGFSIRVQAPKEICDYVGYAPQFYSVAPIGEMPTAVFYRLDAAGELDDPTNSASPIATDIDLDYPASGADIYYYFSGAGRWYSHADLYSTGVSTPAAEEDDLRCPWNYEDVSTVFEGKNCCIGSYYQTKDDDGEIDDGFEDWGGELSACYRGAGILDWEETDNYGIPVYKIYQVPAEGLAFTHDVTAPISAPGDEQIHASNYFSGGTAPRALRDGNTYYWASCLDHNHEVRYRINIQVREWNTADEMPDGDDDVTGNEDAPFSSNPNNDFSDWDDLLTSGSGIAVFGLDGDNVENLMSNITGDIDDEVWLGFVEE